MQIGITGATGFLGRSLIQLALRRGYEVIAFSRNPTCLVRDCVETRAFSLQSPPDLRGCGAMIHLAGEPIAGWWSRSKRRRIRDSRVEGTRRIVEAIHDLSSPPEVLVAASAVGIYGDREDEELTEAAPPGRGVLVDVCKEWEAETQKLPRVRVANMRFGMILGTHGGAFPPLKRASRAMAGARLGPGSQWVSWIHVHDAASLIFFALENLEAAGPFNATAPWPVTNADFTRKLAAAVRRPAFLRIPAWLLRAILGDLAGILLESTRALPAAALELDFPFAFPGLNAAFADLTNRSFPS